MGKRDLITKDFALYVVHYYNSMLTWSKEDILGEIDIAIKEAKPVDAVLVVRCKDCVNYCGFEHCKNGICDLDSVSKRAVYPNDFCSYGERKDNDYNKTDH